MMEPDLAAHIFNRSTWEAETGPCVEFWARQGFVGTLSQKKPTRKICRR